MLLERGGAETRTNCQLRGIELSQMSIRCGANKDDSLFFGSDALDIRGESFVCGSHCLASGVDEQCFSALVQPLIVPSNSTGDMKWRTIPNYYRSWHTLYVFLNTECVQDVQCKFTHNIVTTSNSCLGEHTVCAALPNIVVPR